MLLFSNIFDSLSNMDYDPELFGKALPCLIAIGCALPPDYSLSKNTDDDLYGKPTGGVNLITLIVRNLLNDFLLGSRSATISSSTNSYAQHQSQQ